MQSSSRLLLFSFAILAGCGSQDASRAQGGGAELIAENVSISSLKAAASDAQVKSFYEGNDWQPVWSSSSAEALEKALGERARHGLDRIAFLAGEKSSPAAREVALTQAALRFVRALARGVVDPNRQYEIYTIPMPEPDLAGGLRAALADGRLGEWLQSLAPSDPRYRAISDAYAQLRGSADRSASRIAGGDNIEQGDHDPRVPLIRGALIRLGYLERGAGEPAEADSDLYSGRLKQAVERMQAERGIAKDGIVGPATVKALNTGRDDRARAAAVALERRRWLERDPPAHRIDVKTAAAVLELYRDGAVVDRRKVVVGQPGWKTPQLQSPMHRLVANPTWTVPRSIERSELANVSASYLRSRNMVRRDGWIVQLPGPENALGLVKFDMRNQYAIYLHDTPAQSLFQRNLRQLSHGCVRVNDALGFASTIAREQGIMSEWREARQTGDETFVALPRQIPVRLLYHPTYVTASGKVRFEQDTYGWNDAIGRKLGFAEASRDARTPNPNGDIGP